MTLTTIDRPAASEVRLVQVPTGSGVPLVDRVRMQVGLALLLAGTEHADRPARERRPRRVVRSGHPAPETARPFC